MKSFNMDTAKLLKVINKKTKLIIPVHMLGNPCNMSEIQKISKINKIPILEDACEALGAKYKDQYLGTLGDVGIFSLDFGKTITTGEGGLITTNRKKLHKKFREYHDHGHENNPKLPRGNDSRTNPGLNLRMSELASCSRFSST